jgi:hypothetical protein
MPNRNPADTRTGAGVLPVERRVAVTWIGDLRADERHQVFRISAEDGTKFVPGLKQPMPIGGHAYREPS